MAKSVLVTLADENYIDQAKQLFSSVYCNAGWKGDYLLLAHNIPTQKLAWFTNKGILVKETGPIEKRSQGNFPAVVSAKYHLFEPEFKKWDQVVYIDADCIVRETLNELIVVKHFAAV